MLMDSWIHSSAVHVSLMLSSKLGSNSQFEPSDEPLPRSKTAKGLENITNTEATIHRRLAGMCSLSTAKLIEC